MFWMISHHDLHITCACGRYRYLSAQDIPSTWLDETGLNILPWVFDRFVCLSCGRRGRPMSTNISPLRWRGGMSGGTRETLPLIHDRSAGADGQG